MRRVACSRLLLAGVAGFFTALAESPRSRVACLPLFFLDHQRRHKHLKKMTKPQRSWSHRNLLPPESKSKAFAGSNVTRILWPDQILVSELPCKARVNETPERVFV